MWPEEAGTKGTDILLDAKLCIWKKEKGREQPGEVSLEEQQKRGSQASTNHGATVTHPPQPVK